MRYMFCTFNCKKCAEINNLINFKKYQVYTQIFITIKIVCVLNENLCDMLNKLLTIEFKFTVVKTKRLFIDLIIDHE